MDLLELQNICCRDHIIDEHVAGRSEGLDLSLIHGSPGLRFRDIFGTRSDVIVHRRHSTAQCFKGFIQANQETVSGQRR